MERYEKIKVIGQGAFGKVFLVRRKMDKFLVVIKQIPLDEMVTEERTAAQNEAEVLKMLYHPNIIHHFDSFIADTTLNIVMEYAPGGTLYEFIQQRNNKLLEEERVMQFFAQILVALEHVHSRNIMHRDLKTQNIMLCKKKKVVKIGDFGISKVLSSKITSAKTVVGTPCYISPEICEGKIYRKKSDIWALGCILYELVTLRKAFEADNLPALVNKIMQANVKPIDQQYSKGLEQLLKTMLQLNPDDRPSIEDIMAEPFVINALINLYTDIGRLPCTNRAHRVLAGTGDNPSSSGVMEKASKRVGTLGKLVQASFFDDAEESVSLSSVHSEVFLWGGGINVPFPMPLPPEDEIIQIATGRNQQVAITKEGKLIVWECASGSMATTQFQTLSEGRTLTQISFVPRPMKYVSSFKKVSCGDHFTICLTDGGMIVTFGSGINGCLGHGNFKDLKEPTLVEGLLEKEVIDISAGANHVVVITADGCLFAWGQGEMGRLGLGNDNNYCSVQEVPLPSGHNPVSVCCGTDASIVVTKKGRVLATGNNNYNKLALNGTVAESLTEDNGLAGHLHLSHNNTVIHNVPLQPDLKDPMKTPSSKLLRSTMSSSILSSSLKLARQLLEENQNASDKKADSSESSPSDKEATTCIVVTDATMTQQNDKITDSDKSLPVVHHVNRFRPITFKQLTQEQVTAVSMGTLHTAFVTVLGKCITTGCNTNGQLGYHRTPMETQPGVVEAIGQGVTMVTCGDSFTTAVTKSGEVYAWGKSQRGRLGREEKLNYCPRPQQIPFECPYHVLQISSHSSVTLLMGKKKK